MLSASALGVNVAWYENMDGLGDFGEQQTISEEANNASFVYSADLDGDGDNDVLSGHLNGNHGDGMVAWYENTDGLGNFGTQQVFEGYVCCTRSVTSSDLDGDGDPEVLAASSGSVLGYSSLTWYENTNGFGEFGPRQLITCWPGANSVFSNDLDGDGDNDIILAFWGEFEIEGRIHWYENLDGTGNFGDYQFITSYPDGASCVFSADLDGDGDFDVLSSSLEQSVIAWNRNDGLLGVDDDRPTQLIPGSFLLQPAFPNPFNPETTIKVILPTTSDLRVTIFNISGQEVTTLHSGIQPAGLHSFTFDGSNLASGIYFVRAYVPGRMNEVRKIVLLR